jgi:GntR family transcriptional regulator, galactonate operon transcriptional repressor
MQKRTFRNGRLSERVVPEIQRMIDEEYAQPLSKLPNEASLAERFQVSRIVIREAMKVLQDRGVVEVRAGRGTLTLATRPDIVQESLLRVFRGQPIPTYEEMESMLELRQVLEEMSASLAAVRATEDDLGAIQTALSGMDHGKTLEDTITADLEFHRAVMRAAHNRYLEMVLDPVMSVFLQQIKLTNTAFSGIELHHDIFNQIRARNPVSARQAVRRLMKMTLEDSRRVLSQLPEKAGDGEAAVEGELGSFVR